MGFTPWLYAATSTAQDEIFGFIEGNADLMAIHLDGGVPWPEAFTANNFDNYGSGVKSEVAGLVTRLSGMTNKTIYLAVSPFNSLRDGKAQYWNVSTGESLPSPWDSLQFNSDFVVAAYFNYLDELIKKFDPTYVNYAVEINEYYHNVPGDIVNLQYFFVNLYSLLKAKYPDRIFMVSFAMTSPGSAKMRETADLFQLIKSYVDMVGISVYPYAFYSHPDKGNPANLPSNWLTQIEEIAPDRPYFIAETGFVGESLSIPAFGLEVVSDESKQKAYLEKLFEDSNKLKVAGIVWFAAYDFDDLWNDLLGDNLSLIWRDTGLKDGNQSSRQALDSWKNWLNLKYQPL